MKNQEIKEKPNKRICGHSCGFHCIRMNHFGVKIGQDEILRDVNIHVHCGNLTAIIGRNGAGKSTLLKAILGEVPHTGEMTFTNLREKKHQSGAPKIGYVPQSLSVDKNTPISVYDLLAGYVTRIPVFLKVRRSVKEAIRKQLALFQAEDLIDKAVCDLSGGELQRVLLSLAVMPVPNLLVLDEPAAGIDQKGIQMFYETLNRIKNEYDLAIILVSHDLEYVKKYADQVILLDKTVLVKGSPEKVFGSAEYQDAFGTSIFCENEIR